MREKFIIGNIYHVLSRGVDKRMLFLDDEDRFRFIHDLFEFNDSQPLQNTTYYFGSKESIKNIGIDRKPRKLLVEILAFCIMPNHYHILLRPRVKDGVRLFMKRLNMGYARYFNEKNDRKGALFEGRYKSVPVLKNAHLLHIPYYIHLNPLDMLAPEWRERELRDYASAIKYLQKYRWSSHLDYCGNKNFPSVTQRTFLEELIGGPKEYKSEFTNWLKSLDLAEIDEVALE